jgi:HSP20 family molecular chaperone IbpA
VFKFFHRSYAKQFLTQIILIAAISVEILAEMEFFWLIERYIDKEWAMGLVLSVGIIAIIVPSIYYFGRLRNETSLEVLDSETQITIILKVPGLQKKDIKINRYDTAIEVCAEVHQKQVLWGRNKSLIKKYGRRIDLPSEVNIDTGRSTLTNGILRVVFEKDTESSTKGQINVE